MQFKTHMKEEIKMFLEENDNGKASSEITWDVIKAYVRGEIIPFCVC